MSNTVTTIEALLSRASELKQVSTSPRLDLELLLCHALDQNRTFLFSHPEYTLTDVQFQHFSRLLTRRKTGYPVAYITGRREFWNLELQVEPSTLIPRPDTEQLVETALELCNHRPRRVLDLGTGTGAIALALAKERPNWVVTGCDRIPQAVALAKKNGLRNNLARVTFVESDWFSALDNKTFDLIVSNPPYIVDNDPHLSKGDLPFEPISALTSGADGLNDTRLIISQAPAHLNIGGWLLLEHGWHQGPKVRNILNDHGFVDIRTVKDLAGHDRVTLARQCKE